MTLYYYITAASRCSSLRLALLHQLQQIHFLNRA